jgi:hypothetical protein
VAKLDHELVAGFVVDCTELLQAGHAARFQLIGGQMGATQHVGEQANAGVDVVAKRRAVVRRLSHADRFAALDTEILELRHPSPTVARAGTAEHHFASERGQPGPAFGVEAASGRCQKGECGRFECARGLSDEHHSVLEFFR